MADVSPVLGITNDPLVTPEITEKGLETRATPVGVGDANAVHVRQAQAAGVTIEREDGTGRNQQRRQGLQVWMSFEEDNAAHEPVGMVHFLDRLFARMLCEPLEVPR